MGPRPQPGGFIGHLRYHLPFLKGSSEWPALEFMTRGEPLAPGTKFRVATARCPQHGGSTGRKGQRAASPLSAETEHTARTLSCRHGKQPGTQPAPTTRQADSRFLSDCPGCPTTAALPSPGSVSSPGSLVFGLTPHRGPAGESCAGRANGQHTGQSSGPQPPTGKHPHASAALTPAQPSVLGAAPRQLGRQHCIHCVGPGSRPWSLWVMGGRSRSTRQRCLATSRQAVFPAFPGHVLLGAPASRDTLLSTLITPSLLLGTLPPLLTATCLSQHRTP